jgi:hypothetical protein
MKLATPLASEHFNQELRRIGFEARVIRGFPTEQ